MNQIPEHILLTSLSVSDGQYFFLNSPDTSHYQITRSSDRIFFRVLEYSENGTATHYGFDNTRQEIKTELFKRRFHLKLEKSLNE